MINISFDFDPVSYSVSNILVTEKGTSGLDKIVEQMKEVIPSPTKSTTKTTGRKKKEKNEDIIKLEDNKLVLTQKLIDLLEAEPGDRLCIRFKDFNGEYFPIIAKSEVFADPEAGNKLTKSLTVSYRGKQREELVIYGEEFTFEETFEGSGICKLIGQNTITADDKVFKGNIYKSSTPSISFKRLSMLLSDFLLKSKSKILTEESSLDLLLGKTGV